MFGSWISTFNWICCPAEGKKVLPPENYGTKEKD
jgi:hypothetical protein